MKATEKHCSSYNSKYVNMQYNISRITKTGDLYAYRTTDTNKKHQNP
jgi:hypothetical protein